MVRNAFFAIILLLSITACSIGSPSSERIDTEEDSVYTALLELHYYPAEFFVIIDTTVALSNIDLTYLPGLEETTLQNYLDRNQTTMPLRDDMDLGMPYYLMSVQERESIFTEYVPGWDDFFTRFPDSPGIITLSRVGFNTSFDQAVLYTEYYCPIECGGGQFVLLEKVSEQWYISQIFDCWIS